MKELALSIGTTPIQAPKGIPTGGLEPGGAAEGILSWGLTSLLIFTVLLSLIFFIWAGINWITSEGDKTKVAAARAKLTYAIVGLVVAFLSFFIISLVGFFFDVSLIRVPTNSSPCPQYETLGYCP